MPQRQQLVGLIRTLLLPGALERLRQQRVREHLPRDPLRVQRVGLPALARPVRARRAIRAHVAHIMAAVDQEHGRVPAPARRALDPPPGDLPELPCPRLELTVPPARDAKVRRGENPAARVGDRRGQRPLVRIDPDHIARMIGRHQQVRRSRTAPLRSLHYNLHGLSCWRTGRQHPGGRPPRGERSYQVRPDPSKARTEADTSSARHPSPGVRSLSSQASVQPSTVARAVTHAGDGNSTPGSLRWSRYD